MILPPEHSQPQDEDASNSYSGGKYTLRFWDVVLRNLVQNMETGTDLSDDELQKEKNKKVLLRIIGRIFPELGERTSLFNIPAEDILLSKPQALPDGIVEVCLHYHILSFPKKNVENMIGEIKKIAERYGCELDFEFSPPKLTFSHPQFKW
jgi:hypothetical protein